MAGSSVLRAVPASDRQQRAEPLLGKGGRAKHRLWHRYRPAARYTQVLRAAQSPQGSTAWPAGQDASVQTSCPSSSPHPLEAGDVKGLMTLTQHKFGPGGCNCACGCGRV